MIIGSISRNISRCIGLTLRGAMVAWAPCGEIDFQAGGPDRMDLATPPVIFLVARSASAMQACTATNAVLLLYSSMWLITFHFSARTENVRTAANTCKYLTWFGIGSSMGDIMATYGLCRQADSTRRVHSQPASDATATPSLRRQVSLKECKRYREALLEMRMSFPGKGSPTLARTCGHS